MINDKYFISKFRNKLIEDAPGTNSQKLAYALGYFESMLARLANENYNNTYILQRAFEEYLKRTGQNDKSTKS